MVGTNLRHAPLALAALLAGVVFLAPLLARPTAAAEGGGALDRPVSEAGAFEVDWVLVSALEKRTVEGPCPLPGGLDHVANGGNARNEGHTTIETRGVPEKSVAVAATLYVGVISVSPAPATIVVSFEGHPVVARLVGTSAQPCWNPTGVYALYSANVLAFIPPWINGDYQIAGIPTARSDGGDPWIGSGVALPLAEGASLVIVYSNSGVPATSVVYTHAGPSTFTGGALGIVHPLVPPLPGTSYLRHTRIGADGQKGFSSVIPAAPVAADTTGINGFQIKGVGAPDNQDSDWNGDDGVPLNQLWDTHTTQVEQYVPALPIFAGDVSYTVNYFSPADCVSPSVHVLTAF